MGKVHLVQCLCHRRHAILAVSYEIGELTPTTAVAGLRSLVERLVAEKEINPWCGICRSTRFIYEDGPTRFDSVAEALPELKACEAQQMLSRAILDATTDRN